MATSTSIIQGTNNKPASSRTLVDCFSKLSELDGELFIGYPIIGSPEGRFPIDAVLVSPSKGIIIFDLIEGTDVTGYDARQDDLANKLTAKLKIHKNLTNRRDLVVPINTISFAPGLSLNNQKEAFSEEYTIANVNTLDTALKSFSWTNSNYEHYKCTLSAVQNITTIRQSRSRRTITKENSRGAKLKGLENSISTLDNLQGKAVIETVEGVQRIRGLAGSGKTIVLALKAAYLHAQHPDWQIAVTFHTRALKGQLKRLIHTFSVEQTGEEPDWERIKVLNAWGAPGGEERDGIYYQFCRAVDAPYLDFSAAKKDCNNDNAFGYACEKALTYSTKRKTLYDVILVDEAQDFPSSFLQLCYEILNDKKRLVYAYDELQNLSGVSVATPEEIFGAKSDGEPNVTFPEPTFGKPKSDIILEKCYRNSRPVLVTAHALGFGIYRQLPKGQSTGLVQMFGESGLWREIGYDIKGGELKDGFDVVLQRNPDASPAFLEEHSLVEDLVQFIQFENEAAQVDWVVNEIMNDLQQEELSYDDIIVINPEPQTTREKVGPIRRKLLENGINSHLAGVDTDPDVFFKTDSSSITFTGIHRAKGNEVGMVYIINAHDCNSSAQNLATIRNRLFTAITRSKAWVRILGFGPGMSSLKKEYDALCRENFELKFRYPTQAERDKMSIVNRDVSPAEQRRLRERATELSNLLQDIEAGNIRLEDLPEELVDKLYNSLGKARSLNA